MSLLLMDQMVLRGGGNGDGDGDGDEDMFDNGCGPMEPGEDDEAGVRRELDRIIGGTTPEARGEATAKAVAEIKRLGKKGTIQVSAAQRRRGNGCGIRDPEEHCQPSPDPSGSPLCLDLQQFWIQVSTLPPNTIKLKPRTTSLAQVDAGDGMQLPMFVGRPPANYTGEHKDAWHRFQEELAGKVDFQILSPMIPQISNVFTTLNPEHCSESTKPVALNPQP